DQVVISLIFRTFARPWRLFSGGWLFGRCRLLRGGGLRRRLARPRGRGGGPPVGEQLGTALRRDGRHLVALAQRGVGLAVGHVGAEPPVLDHHRLAAHRVVAQLAQRGRGGGPAAAARLGLREQRLRLVEGDGEHVLLGRQRAALGAALDVGTVPAVLHGDRLPV